MPKLSLKVGLSGGKIGLPHHIPVTCTIDQFSIGKINTISLVLYIYGFNLPWRERERESNLRYVKGFILFIKTWTQIE